MKRPSCPQPARPAGAGTPGPDWGSAPGGAHAAAGFTGSWSLRSAALALAAITFVAYLPVWRAGLIWDDGSFVVNNPLIRQPGGLWQFWFSTRPLDFFPMTSSLLWVEWRLWGASPLGYHVANVCLHLAGTLLLWRSDCRWDAPADRATQAGSGLRWAPPPQSQNRPLKPRRSLPSGQEKCRQEKRLPSVHIS